MDFTVRWFAEPSANMSTIRTTQIIPVELNAYLYDMERNMAAFANELGDASSAANFTAAAAARATAITTLMWNASAGGGCFCCYQGTNKVADEWRGQRTWHGRSGCQAK